MTIIEIITMLLGGGNIFQFYLSWQSRKSNVKGTEADAMAKMQDVYDKFTLQSDVRFDKMQEVIDKQADEIKGLKKLVIDYKNKCENCKNSK
jgi:hypothetical protein